MAKIKDKYEANIVGHWDFRKGTIADQSDNAADGSFGGAPYWRKTRNGKALIFDGANDYIEVGSGVTHCPETSAWSLFIVYDIILKDNGFNNMVSFTTNSDNPYEVAIGNGSGYNGLLLGARELFVETDTNASGLEEFVGCHAVGVSYNGSGGETKANTSLYFDGASKTTVTTGAFGAKTNETVIGAATTAPVSVWDGGILEVIVFDTELTAAEQAQLYTESRAEAHLSHIPETTTIPELLANSDLSDSANWTQGVGWSIANGSASCDGSQVAVSDLKQTVGTAGEDYIIEFEIIDYTAGNVSALAGDATGASRSAVGIYKEKVTATSDGDLGIQADADFIGEISYINIGQGENYLVYQTGEDWEVTSIAVSSGEISNSKWEVTSGSWNVVDSPNGKKHLSCSTSGIASLLDVNVKAEPYGTWEIDMNKNGEESVMDVYLIRQDDNNGYILRFDTDETIALVELVAGVPTDLITTTAQSVATWYTVKLTRKPDGEFELFLDDVSIGTATDTTVTVASTILLDMGIEDAVRNFRHKPTL